MAKVDILGMAHGGIWPLRKPGKFAFLALSLMTCFFVDIMSEPGHEWESQYVDSPVFMILVVEGSVTMAGRASPAGAVAKSWRGWRRPEHAGDRPPMPKLRNPSQRDARERRRRKLGEQRRRGRSRG